MSKKSGSDPQSPANAEEQRIDADKTSRELQDFVRECEVTGRRTVFSRRGSPIAILVSYDEYIALRETIAITAQPELLQDIHQSEADAARGALLPPEDFFVE